MAHTEGPLQGTPVLPLLPTDEERMLRETVREICAGFGPEYSRRKTDEIDQAIQTHGGNGFALEYGLTDMWWGVRLVRTAPVSREMILNYVAEHSLGLPRSY